MDREVAILHEVIITDVEDTDTDESLWAFIRDTVLLAKGVSVPPWVTYTVSRDGAIARVSINGIEVYEPHDDDHEVAN